MRWSDEYIIGNNTRNNYRRAFDNNRKAKVMDDTIKRSDAIKAISEYFSDDDDSHWNAIATYIIKDIPSAEKQGDWIPCSERLPEANEVVLVCYKTTDTIHLCKYLGDGSENPWWSYIDDCCAWNNTVLAWMPLPKPWEGADDE